MNNNPIFKTVRDNYFITARLRYIFLSMYLKLGNMYLKRVVIKWLSRTVLKTSSADVKWIFHELEKLKLKLVFLKSHRKFNETCHNNDLLPTYANI